MLIHDDTSIAMRSLPRSDFTNCRVERLPSGTVVSDLARHEGGLEAFPAVYRAPSLFGHRSGYEFPEVRGHACYPKKPTCSQPLIPVSPMAGLPTRPKGRYQASWRRLERRFRGLPRPFRRAWGLSPLLGSLRSPTSFSFHETMAGHHRGPEVSLEARPSVPLPIW